MALVAVDGKKYRGVDRRRVNCRIEDQEIRPKLADREGAPSEVEDVPRLRSELFAPNPNLRLVSLKSFVNLHPTVTKKL